MLYQNRKLDTLSNQELIDLDFTLNQMVQHRQKAINDPRAAKRIEKLGLDLSVPSNNHFMQLEYSVKEELKKRKI